jgi:HD-GYP domain-containing protein (c-di-GMP phosphodiesterase class II)/HAMP domain-containing protein
MQSGSATHRYPFHVGITTLVIAIVLVLSGIFLWISRTESEKAAFQVADRLFEEIARSTGGRYEMALEAVSGLTRAAARMPGMARRPSGDGLSHPALGMMADALQNDPNLFSLYCGYEDGSFIQVTVVRDGDPGVAALFGAPKKRTRFVLRTISTGKEALRVEHWRFLDEGKNLIGERDEPEPSFDPRIRPWYTEAVKRDAPFFTPPYVFDATRMPGITCSERLAVGGGIFGADITLQHFAASLQRLRISPGGLLFFFDEKKHLIAHSKEEDDSGIRGDALKLPDVRHAEDPRIRFVAREHLDHARIPLGKTRVVAIDGTPHLVHLSGMDPKLGFDQILAAVAPQADFTDSIRRMEKRVVLFFGLTVLLVLPLGFYMARRISGALRRLEQEARKVQRFDFSPSPPFDSRIAEIHALIQAFVLMKTTIRDRTDALVATQKKLESLVDSGIALTAETDMDKLLEKIFHSARLLSRADRGRLYLRDENDRLRLEIFFDSDRVLLRPDRDPVADDRLVVPISPLPPAEGRPRVESHVALTGETVVIDDPEESPFDLPPVCRLEDGTDAVCNAYLTVPLKTREGDTLGVLQIVDTPDETDTSTGAFGREVVGFVEALAAQAAVALDNKRLLEEQRELFDAMIQLIAGAIDAKSPYTGGHCARVPVLAMMLAEAADASTREPFADFQLETEDQWREMRVAAWLHDCGKVTTPEYVVDKATKLETLYDRIHEVRMRFEVLLRDVDIEYHEALLAGSRPEPELRAERERKRREIMDDYAFVARCNVGGEFMEDERIERLHRIARRTWLRHLDDRIGISQEEARRKDRLPHPELPVLEPVLADRPDHVIPRDGSDPFGDGNPHGFRMEVPELRYNLGELYNLGTRKGTLTAEDRFKINEHIVQTLIMLKKLPFPEYLEEVPEIAASHHETMDGKGYPRRLTREDMSVPARIMAIADIFEALTASDRPYKSTKTLSESLSIMARMRDDHHIDPDLFDLFLTSGVYLAYGNAYLQESQNDAVDIDAFLSTPRAPLSPEGPE